jgi:hypothetical protein
VARAAGRPVPSEVVAVLSAEHCTPYAEMDWVAELMATNARLLAA